MAPPLTGFVDFSDLASARHCPEQLERRTVSQNRPPGQQLTRALGGTRRAVASHSLGKTSRPQPIDQIDMVKFDIYASRYKNASKQSASPAPEAALYPTSLARNHKKLDRQFRYAALPLGFCNPKPRRAGNGPGADPNARRGRS